MSKYLCIRCLQGKQWHDFIEGFHEKNLCKLCMTKKELLEFLQPELTKLMRGLKPKEKQIIIREMMNDHKKKKEEARREACK